MSEHNYQAFWEEALNQIHQEYAAKGEENEFQIWFNMEYVEDTLNEITVSVASDFMWFKMNDMHYVSSIEAKLCELTGRNLKIKPLIRKNSIKKREEIIEDLKKSSVSKNTDTQNATSYVKPERSEFIQSQNNESENEKVSSPLNISTPKEFKIHPQLNSNYTFENFVIGDKNEFAYSASLAVAKNPGKAYNPILIYGGVGLGKTHLMHSIGNYIYNQRGENLKMTYLTAENFTNEFLFSLRNKTTEQFKNKYRKLDVLLLDDIHFITDKEVVQEELFHTFEALYQKKAQMVFTCDRPINELKNIEDRLKNRFTRGMSVNLQLESYEIRVAILQKKIIDMGKRIPEDFPNDVIDFVAKNVQTNIRDLEGILTNLVGYIDLIKKPLTLEFAQNTIRNTLNQIQTASISIETIQKVVADHYNISLSDIKGKKKTKKFIGPRQIAIYIARQMGGYSYPQLGDEFGGKDHTTMMHSFNLINDRIKIDSNLDQIIKVLMREIQDYKKQ